MLFFSLPIDGIVLLYLQGGNHRIFSPQLGGIVTSITLVLALVASSPDLLLNVSERIQDLQYRTTMRAGRRAPLIILGFLILSAVTEIGLRAGISDLLPILLSVFVAGSGIISAYRTWNKHLAASHFGPRNRFYWTRRVDRTVGGVYVACSIVIRSASLVCTLVAGMGEIGIELWIATLICSFLFFTRAQPIQEKFYIRCKGCSKWVSRALRALESCPNCSRRLFRPLFVS